jgi:hypothetical protein
VAWDYCLVKYKQHGKSYVKIPVKMKKKFPVKKKRKKRVCLLKFMKAMSDPTSKKHRRRTEKQKNNNKN